MSLQEWTSDSDEYVGEEDSTDAASSDEDFELGNVVGSEAEAVLHSSHAPPARHHIAPHQDTAPIVPTSWRIASKGRQRQESGSLPLILFDLNGVLMQHRFDGTAHHHDLRPGVHHLLRLLSHFRLGVYTSSTRSTVQRALNKLAGNLHNALQQAQRVQQAGFPPELPPQLFHVIMCREHCLPADKNLIAERGGKPWDTVKPLHRYFADLSRVLLVDDSPHKSLCSEAANMLVTPRWHGPGSSQGKVDTVLPALVDALLYHTRFGLDDVRAMTAGIARQLAALVGAPPPALATLVGATSAASLAVPAGMAVEAAVPSAAVPVEAAIPAATVPAALTQPDGEPQRESRRAKKKKRKAGAMERGSEKEGADVVTAMRLLYVDCVKMGCDDWWCKPADVVLYLDALLPGIRQVLMLQSFPPHLVKSTASSGLIELASMRMGLEGQWLRLAAGSAAPTPDRWEEIRQYAAAAPAKEPRKRKRKGQENGEQKRKEQEGHQQGEVAAHGHLGQQQLQEEQGGEQGPVEGEDAQQGRSGQRASRAELNAIRRDVLLYCLAGLQERGGVSPQSTSSLLSTRLAMATASNIDGRWDARRVTSLIQRAEAACVKSGEVMVLGGIAPEGSTTTAAAAVHKEVAPRGLAWHTLPPGTQPPPPTDVVTALERVGAWLRTTVAADMTQHAQQGPNTIAQLAAAPATASSPPAALQMAEKGDARGTSTHQPIAAPTLQGCSAAAAPQQLPAAASMLHTEEAVATTAASSGAVEGVLRHSADADAGGAPLLLAVFEDRGPGRATEEGTVLQHSEPSHHQHHLLQAHQLSVLVEGSVAALAQHAQQGESTGQPRKHRNRWQRVSVLAESLGLPLPADNLTKVQLAVYGKELLQEQLRRQQQQQGDSKLIRKGPGETTGNEEEEDMGPATKRRHLSPAIEPAAREMSPAKELHGGHFLRSHGSMEPAEPAMPVEPQHAQQQAVDDESALEVHPAELAMAANSHGELNGTHDAALPYGATLVELAMPAQQAERGGDNSELGQEAAPETQQSQQGEVAGLSKKQKRRLRMIELADSLGVPPPREKLSKAQLAVYRKKLFKKQQQLLLELDPNFVWEGQGDDSEEGVEDAGLAAERQQHSPAVQPMAGDLSPAQALHGGHFLRSCGSGEPAEPSMPLSPRQTQQADVVLQQARRARLVQPAAESAQHARAAVCDRDAAHPSGNIVVESAVPALYAQHDAPSAQHPFSPLHYEVVRFAQQATPTPQEVADVQRAVEGVAAVARSLWPQAVTVLFGSQATGLALPGSDLDIVVLNVGPHIQRAGTGFMQAERKQLGELLEDLLDGLLAAGLIHGKAQIIEARVPIIKCCLAVGPGLMADLSLGATNGAAAVDYVRQQVLAVAPLRPLCLIIKAFLRERGLNEVFTGGLSSYTVFNLVMAHLMREGFSPSPHVPSATPGALPETFTFLAHLASSVGRHPLAQHAQHTQHGADVQQTQQYPVDLGVLLYGFFDLFGCRFGYTHEAVSVRLGGVCSKIRAWRQARRPWLLAVEDPQEPGKDIASGSFSVKDIKVLFGAVAELLAEVCEDAVANAEVAPEDAAAQQAQRGSGSGSGVLSGVINIESAVGRGSKGIKARKALAERAAAKSAVVKQQRFRQGVRVGGPALPKLAFRGKKQQGQQQQQTQRGGRGSKRTRLVEAQWSHRDGQFRDDDGAMDWSLRKEKKSGKRKSSSSGGSRTSVGGKRGVVGGKRRKGVWVTDTGSGVPGLRRRRQRSQV